MKKAILSYFLVLFPIITIGGEINMKSIPAKWHHELYSTYLTDYKKDEHLIISSIYSGTPGKDAVVKYDIEVKIESWDTEFIQNKQYEYNKSKYKEILSITLSKMHDPKCMKAKYSHIVIMNGIKEIESSGLTELVRVNQKE